MRVGMICSVFLGLALMAGAMVLTFRPEPTPIPAESKYAGKVHVQPVVVATVTRESRFTAITQPYSPVSPVSETSNMLLLLHFTSRNAQF